ncbi:hypothetical protein Hypma_008377 [Hypsizygus marmoreus]|uniref:Uncharacterized protein n=1 Tax=Hypsizygus marmoreus TaxID=39966 RepID=A0A369JQ67_HYPMA|nr:hypothetical protein Hypma_008377 [Hypsizygus marmoreus]
MLVANGISGDLGSLEEMKISVRSILFLSNLSRGVLYMSRFRLPPSCVVAHLPLFWSIALPSISPPFILSFSVFPPSLPYSPSLFLLAHTSIPPYPHIALPPPSSLPPLASAPLSALTEHTNPLHPVELPHNVPRLRTHAPHAGSYIRPQDQQPPLPRLPRRKLLGPPSSPHPHWQLHYTYDHEPSRRRHACPAQDA